MYHIKDDKRAIKSSKLIYDGLITCMKEKKFDKITITDIQKASSVGRATFYRHFDNLSDVLLWKCDISFHDLFVEIIEEDATSTVDHSTEKYYFMSYLFDYWTTHIAILEQLLNINRMDIIFQCHYKNSIIITEYFRGKFDLPDTNYEYYMGLRIGAFIGVLITWITNGKKENSRELVKIIIEQYENTLGNSVFL